MTRVRFLSSDGALVAEAVATSGQSLLELAQGCGQPLEGTCEGQMACSTCHVIVDAEDFSKLAPASEEEEDLLDLASHATRTSRLACQILLDPGLECLSVRIPAGAHDMRGR